MPCKNDDIERSTCKAPVGPLKRSVWRLSRTTGGAPTARMKTCDMIGQPQILHCLRSEKGLALGPVAVAHDRDFEHPKKIFAGICSIFCSKPDQTVDGGLARMTKVFMSDYYLR